MPEYHCDTCDYTTNILTHYNKHLRTKKHVDRIHKSYTDTNSYLSPNTQTKKYFVSIVTKNLHSSLD